MKGLNEIKSLMYKLNSGILTEAVLMEATRDEIYTQYYDEQHGKVKQIPRDIFDELCRIGDVDGNPQKMSEFAKWLCDGFKKVGLSSFIYDTKIGYILARGTDLKKDFMTFRKLQKIKPEGIDLNLRNYNIETFREKMEYARENGLDFSQKDIKKLGSDTVYQDDTWKVVIIKSRDASLYYGRGTTWCTSSTDSSMYFDDYMSRGLLFIFINTTNNAKYQGFYSFDFEWDEFKDPKNNTVYPEDIFSKEMFDSITEKASTMLEERFATVWENEAVVDEDYEINDTFKVIRVERINRYRVKNMKTGEFLSLPKGNTFTGVGFDETYNILFLEINYGIWGVVYINGDNAEIIEPNIKSYTSTSIDVYDENHYFDHREDKEYIMFHYGGKTKIFNAKQRTFLKINGKEVFEKAFGFGNAIGIKMFNGKYVMFSMKENRPILVNSELYVDKISYVGYNLYFIIAPKGSYLYNTRFSSFLPIPDEDSVTLEDGFVAINIGDEQNSVYRIYNIDTNTFLKAGDVDVFDDYQLLLRNVFIFYKSSDAPHVWLYNGHTESFCESDDIPCYETDIEAYYMSIMLFWGNNDILMGYDISKNEVFQLPVTIDYDSVQDTSKTGDAMIDKYQPMVTFLIGDNSESVVGIWLQNENRTIIYKRDKDEKPKVYHY